VITKLGGRAGATVRATTVSAPAQLAAAAGELRISAEALAGVSAADNRFATPAGEAAEPSIIPILDEAAPVAEELAMSGEKTAAAQDAGAAIESREDKLSRLAEMHPGLAARLPVWIRDKKTTVESIQEEIAAHYVAREDATHVNTARPVFTGGEPNESKKPFGSFGEQLVAIVQAGRPGGRTDQRLLRINREVQRLYAGTPSGMNEGVGSEGGFFIAPELLPGIMDPIYAEDPLLSRVFRVPIGAGRNSVEYLVVDETARTNGSRWGGIQMFWVAEADTATAKKPKMRKQKLALNKLMGIAYLTEEQGEDAPATEALLSRAFSAETAWMLADAIFRGTGAGQPQGFMNGGGLVTQAIEGTQTIANTDTFVAKNLSKMLSRVPAGLWGDLIWLYNQELLPYLITATVGGTAAVPVFMAQNSLTNRPNDTILGRPAFASELCEAVGTPGDLVLIAPSQYHMADKGGPRQSASAHVRFLYDENALKITLRTDGQPLWYTTLTPYKGANVRSPYVVLNTRT
jgi:HK97 family phage major capsid protein